MITAKTSSGFEIELDENIFRKDTELTEAIVFLDTDESGKCLLPPSTTCWARRARSACMNTCARRRAPWRWTIWPRPSVSWCPASGRKKLCILADLIASDEDALICDFAQYYHVLDWRTLPLHLVATLAAGLPESSRCMLKLSGQIVPLETLLQAETVDALHLLYWRLCVGKGAAPQLILDGLQGREGGNASDVQSLTARKNLKRRCVPWKEVERGRSH